jgi:hypothetical protein
MRKVPEIEIIQTNTPSSVTAGSPVALATSVAGTEPKSVRTLKKRNEVGSQSIVFDLVGGGGLAVHALVEYIFQFNMPLTFIFRASRL